MLQHVEEEIKRQLDENGTIDVDREGRIKTNQEFNPFLTNPITGEETTRLPRHRVYALVF